MKLAIFLLSIVLSLSACSTNNRIIDRVANAKSAKLVFKYGTYGALRERKADSVDIERLLTLLEAYESSNYAETIEAYTSDPDYVVASEILNDIGLFDGLNVSRLGWVSYIREGISMYQDLRLSSK